MNIINLCRLCLGQSSLINIFEQNYISTNIMSVVKIDISSNDGLPETICTGCLKKLDDCIEFINLCKTSDTELRKTILKNNSLETDDDNFLNINDSPKSEIDIEFDKPYIPCEGTHKHEDTKHRFLSKDRKDNVKSRKADKQQCSICGKVLSCSFRLKSHLRTHSGERPFSCPHCTKKFALNQNLKVHLRTHTGEKPLHCTICGEKFAQTAGLAAHKLKHTGQKPYNCTLCPKSFRTFSHHQYHVRCHTGEKKFECDTCGRAFVTRYGLKHHFMTHTGDRPHVCSECGGRFTRATHLKRHVQRMHANQDALVKVKVNKKVSKNKRAKHNVTTDHDS